MDIREAALNAIMEVMEEGKYSHKVLKNMLDKLVKAQRQERAFFTRLSLGVIENAVLLDYEINKYSKTGTDKMKPFIRNILRMGAYQIGYMESVPVSAACNEAVKLTKKHGFAGLSGFVNAVLRNIARNKETFGTLPEDIECTKKLSIKYSTPEWLVRHIQNIYAENTELILLGLLKEKPVSVRINNSLTSRSAVMESLKKDDITVSDKNVLEEAIILEEFDNISEITAFSEGLLQVQDQSSMLVCRTAGINEGNYVIDVCAAPGGKSIHAADILLTLNKANPGFVSARDITASKTALINDNIKRCGFKNMEAVVKDALELSKEDIGKADVVIADLPCSGIGIIGREPDIKYKLSDRQLTELPILQRNILKVVSRYVKQGGTLMYSTCTINPEENEKNYEFILNELGFKSVSIEEYLPQTLKGRTGSNGYIQVLPTDYGMDGFFVSKAVKV